MYLLFAGNDYYAEGGADDLQGWFETLDEAIKAHDPNKFTYDGGWANVLRLDNLKIAKHFSRGTWYEPRETPNR